MSGSDTESERFRLLFERYADPVLAYARRHGDSTTAEDVASETFLIAWRRRTELPDEPLAWLIVVARNLIANRQRGLVRAKRLHIELSALRQATAPEAAVDGVVVGRAVMLSALESLTPTEREALLLVGWDGLSGREAARVLDCSERTFNVRLHRARKRLTRALDSAELPRPTATLSASHPMKETR